VGSLILIPLEDLPVAFLAFFPVRSPTLIGFDLPLITIIGITGKRKKILTYT
jgi:hypothetical protein